MPLAYWDSRKEILVNYKFYYRGTWREPRGT